MKRKLELILEFDDGPWFSADMEEWNPTDPLAYAMDQVNSAIPHINGDVHFVEAKLDGELLINRNGETLDEVKSLALQYNIFMEKVYEAQTPLPLDKEYTVKEFVQAILEKHPDTGGSIYLLDDKTSYGTPSCQYHSGFLAEMSFTGEMQNKIIKEVLVNGSHCRDYHLKV